MTRSPLVARLAVLVRLGAWFFPKLPPLLAVGYAQMLLGEPAAGPAVAKWALTVTTICCLAAYGYLVNDLSDVEADRRAGKSNSLARLSPAQRVGACALVAAAGLASLPVLPRAAAVALVADYVLATVYSVPPFRLKERGILGVINDATAVHALPTLYVVLMFAGPGPWPPRTAALAVAAPAWALLFGLRGITSHQVWDCENDRRSGTRTLVTRIGSERARLAIRWALFPAEMAALLALVAIVLPSAPAVGAVVAGYAGLDLLRWRVWRVSLDPAPAATGRYMPPAELYQAWLPLGLAVQLAVRNPALAAIPLLHVVLFLEPLVHQAREVARLVADAGRAFSRALRSQRPPSPASGA